MEALWKSRRLACVTLKRKQNRSITCQSLVHFAGFGHLDRQAQGTRERAETQKHQPAQPRHTKANSASPQVLGISTGSNCPDGTHLGPPPTRPSPSGPAAVFREPTPGQSSLGLVFSSSALSTPKLCYEQAHSQELPEGSREPQSFPVTCSHSQKKKHPPKLSP